MPDSVPQTAMQPIEKANRIHILDILRGFAVFGILAVNIGGFANPSFYPGYVAPSMPWFDRLAETLMQFLAEGKFYTIFSFLFGLGFSVQLARASAKGQNLNSFYPRRLWVLFAFGLLHSLLFWIGDILRLYALLGFALLAFRNRSSRTLLFWIGVSLVFHLLPLGQLGGPAGDSEGLPGMDVISMARQAYNSNSFISVVIFQFFAGWISFIVIALTQGGTVMALFLLGLLVGRLNFFERLPDRLPILKKALLAGLLIGLVFNTLFVFVDHPWVSSLGFIIGAPALAAFYISGLSLLSLTKTGAKLLAPIGQVGRMALSNYVLQSIVCSLIFNGYGLGMYEKIGPAGLWGLTLAIYLIQIPLSVWWLGRFQFGPLEWLWRSLTYRQRQPFLVKQA